MGLKNNLEKRVRGWLPKKPNLPPHQQTKNHSAPRMNRIGIVIIAIGFVGGLLGALTSSFGLVSRLGMYVLAIIAAIVITDIAAFLYIRKKRKKQLETTTQGWLPKEPGVTDISRIVISHNSLLRLCSLLLPTMAIASIAVFCYSTLLVFFDVQINATIGWLLLTAYLFGIDLAIIGDTIRLRLNPESPPSVKKPVFILGLSFLTVSVLGFIFDNLFSAFMITYPFSVHSLLVRLLIYWRTGWLSLVFLCFGFLGGVLLLASGALSSQFSKTEGIIKKRHYRGFYILAVGTIIIMAGFLIEAFGIEAFSLSSAAAYSLLEPALFAFYAFVEPFGILCLTLGWVTIASTHSKRSPVLLPTLYAVFVALMAILFLIPI